MVDHPSWQLHQFEMVATVSGERPAPRARARPSNSQQELAAAAFASAWPAAAKRKAEAQGRKGSRRSFADTGQMAWKSWPPAEAGSCWMRELNEQQKEVVAGNCPSVCVPGASMDLWNRRVLDSSKAAIVAMTAAAAVAAVAAVHSAMQAATTMKPQRPLMECRTPLTTDQSRRRGKEPPRAQRHAIRWPRRQAQRAQPSSQLAQVMEPGPPINPAPRARGRHS